MDRTKEIKEELRAIRTRVGYSIFDEAVRSLNRERLDAPRTQKRKSFAWSMVAKLYERQKGICPVCTQPMRLLKSARAENEVDHINPMAPDFNNPRNLQLLHKSCNRSKSALSVMEQAKRYGITAAEILNPTIEENE